MSRVSFERSGWVETRQPWPFAPLACIGAGALNDAWALREPPAVRELSKLLLCCAVCGHEAQWSRKLSQVSAIRAMKKTGVKSSKIVKSTPKREAQCLPLGRSSGPCVGAAMSVGCSAASCRTIGVWRKSVRSGVTTMRPNRARGGGGGGADPKRHRRWAGRRKRNGRKWTAIVLWGFHVFCGSRSHHKKRNQFLCARRDREKMKHQWKWSFSNCFFCSSVVIVGEDTPRGS